MYCTAYADGSSMNMLPFALLWMTATKYVYDEYERDASFVSLLVMGRPMTYIQFMHE
jgi:hypothetical protein